MREFVAVNNLETITDAQTLKREALMFNRIATEGLGDFLCNKNAFSDMSDIIKDIEWLLAAGIIFEPKRIPNANIQSDEYKFHSEASLWKAIELTGLLSGISADELIEACNDGRTLPEKGEEEFGSIVTSDAFMRHAAMLSAYSLRVLSIQLRELNKMDAYPVLPTDIHLIQEHKATKDEVVKIVLNSLPIPSDKTSWEQIIEYRSDPDSQRKFLDLRHWISEVARGGLPPNEIEEKLEYLLSQYQRHIEVHRIKANTGTLETWVTTGAEILGNLLSFQWGKAAKALFSIKNRQIALLEGELSAPGNEVAYIVKAREALS